MLDFLFFPNSFQRYHTLLGKCSRNDPKIIAFSLIIDLLLVNGVSKTVSGMILDIIENLLTITLPDPDEEEIIPVDPGSMWKLDCEEFQCEDVPIISFSIAFFCAQSANFLIYVFEEISFDFYWLLLIILNKLILNCHLFFYVHIFQFCFKADVVHRFENNCIDLK